MNSRLATIRYYMRRRMLDSSTFGHAYRRLRPAYAEEGRLDRSRDVVIEGYPRSGTSYARFAFQLAQPGDVRVGGHAHSAQLVKEAVALGLPTVLIIRFPDDAVASLVQFEPGLRLATAYRGYFRFYSAIHKLKRNKLLVVRFETVVADFGQVIEEVNLKWGTSFARYDKTSANESTVSDWLVASDVKYNRGISLERSVARPSAARKASSEVIRNLDRSTASARIQAFAIYQQISVDL